MRVTFQLRKPDQVLHYCCLDLNGAPQAGDTFKVMRDEREAKEHCCQTSAIAT
jgi:hypothetical protein